MSEKRDTTNTRRLFLRFLAASPLLLRGKELGEIGGAVFVTQAVAALLCGRYCDRWLARGGTSTRVRKTFF